MTWNGRKGFNCIYTKEKASFWNHLKVLILIKILIIRLNLHVNLCSDIDEKNREQCGDRTCFKEDPQ